MLTEHERHLLDEIELQLARTDPRLASRLTGVRLDRWRFRLRAVQGGFALTMWAVGCALVVGFFATQLLLAMIGLAHMLVAALLGAAPATNRVRAAGGRVVRWWASVGASPVAGNQAS